MKPHVCAAAVLAIGTAAGGALAQEAPLPAPAATPPISDEAARPGTIQAPKSAFEINLGAGYTQPLGSINATNSISKIAGPGFSPSLELGYRIDPHWSVGLGGQYHESSPNSALAAGSHVRGFAVNVDATYHFLPYRFIDPYAQLGTGYRAFWELPVGSNNNLSVHGFELGRLQVGLDYRVTKDMALGPYVGADLDMFAFQHPQNASTSSNLTGNRVSTFLSAGIAGRFDLGGERVPKPVVAAVPAETFEAAVPTPPPAPPETESLVTLEATIVEQCGVSGERAYFEFDSANIGAAASDTLDKVAKCLTEGTLKGRSVMVIGHADPRGTTQYNERLGLRRAESVRDYLSAHGVPASAVEAESHGELQATGTNEASWAIDRRVEIDLKP
ncbi:MAG TPA: OmpA family protein [Minicystis sp.]|nr:OmpA family protein [Minicystis sp.]